MYLPMGTLTPARAYACFFNFLHPSAFSTQSCVKFAYIYAAEPEDAPVCTTCKAPVTGCYEEQAATHTRTHTFTNCAPRVAPNRPPGPIHLKQGQTVVLTNDRSKQASSEVLPITWPSSFMGNGLQPGSLVFVGQYLFTGSETTSAYLTVYQASEWHGERKSSSTLFDYGSMTH
eukprot:1157419-Pelagomonas_calceolata.AAC.9